MTYHDSLVEEGVEGGSVHSIFTHLLHGLLEYSKRKGKVALKWIAMLNILLPARKWAFVGLSHGSIALPHDD